MDLENRIRDCIKYQLDELTNDGKLAGRKSMQLVPFVGNGLSRIALARYQNQGDESFYKIVADLGNQLELPPIDHLIAKGYTLDEVFRIVIEKGGTESRKNTMYEIWKLYRDIVPDVENGIPSPLHIVLAKMAKAFITTNYDLLIERALQAEGVSRFKQDFCITAPMHKWNSEPFIKWDPESSLPWIYKIHGSFLSLPDSYPTDKPLEDGLFRDVHKGKLDIETIVASAEIYDWWAYECSNEAFEKKFEGPINILQEYKNLVLIVGHGLRAEERIIFRLLQTAIPTASQKPRAAVLTLTFDYEQDAPSPRIPQIIHPVNISPGLAGSSMKRELAHLIFLEMLHEYEILQVDTDTHQYLQRATQKYEPIPVQPTKNLATMTPLLASAGQIAYHTCRGYESAPSQERAYSPIIASWEPDDANPRALEVTAPMGDALDPCYVWEGLGIPVALAGRVGCDEAGRAILNYLGNNTEYIDFSQIVQDTKSGSKTEQATGACWMDLRLILDGERSFDHIVKINEVLPPRAEGRIVYASKPALGSVIQELRNTPNDLFIFDTGNNCSAREFDLAISRRSTVIASALSLYLFIKAYEYVEANPSAEIEVAWENVRNEYFDVEPNDETGRYKQMSLLINVLSKYDFDLFKTPIGKRLTNIEAIAVTLGPLGCIWWSNATKEPTWTRILTSTPPNSSDVSGQSIPFREIRNALGCGDAARAGYISSLVIQSLETTLFDLDQSSAFRAMVWAGTCRLMFWDIRDYMDWLRKVRPLALEWIKNESGICPWPDLPSDSEYSDRREIKHQSLTVPAGKDKLMQYIQTWDDEIWFSDELWGSM